MTPPGDRPHTTTYAILSPVKRRRTLALMTLALVGAALTGCSKSAAKPPASTAASDSTTSSGPPAGGGSPGTPQQTVQTWISEVNAENPSATELLGQPFRADWTRTKRTVWPKFSNVNCQTQSQTTSAATVHCTLSESVYAGERNPPTYWNFNLTAESGGTWLITHYRSG